MLRVYGFVGSVGLAIHWLLTRVFFPNARLVRFRFTYVAVMPCSSGHASPPDAMCASMPFH